MLLYSTVCSVTAAPRQDTEPLKLCITPMAAIHYRGKTTVENHNEELPSIISNDSRNSRQEIGRRLLWRRKQWYLAVSIVLFLIYLVWWWFWPLCLFHTEWKWTTYSDLYAFRVVDCVVSQTNKNDTESIHLAIVIPFVPKEVKYLIPLLQTWDDDGSKPCTSTPTHDTELVFYISQRFDKDETSKRARQEIEQTIQQLKSISTCFASIHFVNANLTDEEDEYRDKGSGWTNSGPNVMFYNMPRRIQASLPPSKRPTHVAYLEVDAAYIRNDWVETLYQHCSWDTWAIGNGGRLPQLYPPSSNTGSESSSAIMPLKSTLAKVKPWKQRKQDLISFKRQHPGKGLLWYEPARFENPYCDPSFSLNGNAIYTIGDQCFVEFVDRLRDSPLFHISYDHNMYLYRCHPLHSELSALLKGKFIQSEVMVDARHLLWNRTYVQAHMKETVVITQADGQDRIPRVWERFIKFVDAMLVGNEWHDC